jgi:hypothetical protein
MNIKSLVRSFRTQGFSEESAEAHSGAEIILRKIAMTKFAEHITIKGSGCVLLNVWDALNVRGATS